MPSSVSISDFKITVKLDSKSAAQGIKNLETQLSKFANKVNNSLKLNAGTAAEIAKASANTGKLTRAARIYNRALNGVKANWKSIKKYSGQAASFGWNLKYAFLGAGVAATALVAKIAQVGSKIQMSGVTLRSAIAGSDIGTTLIGKGGGALKSLQDQQLNFARKLALDYGLSMHEATSQYAKFFAASSNYIGVGGSEKVFSSLTKLGVVYGISSDKMNRAMTAFTQMASKNQVMAEELKQQLGDVLPGSMEIFARAMTKMGKWGTVTVEKLYDMMAKGKIVASEVLPFVAKEMERLALANGALQEAMKTVAKQWDKLSSQAQATSAGIFNQFEKPLSKLISRFTTLLSGEGMQVTIGTKIGNAILYIEEALDSTFKSFEAFEKKWAKATTKKQKLALVDSFFWDVLKGAKDSFFKVFFDSITTAWEASAPIIERVISGGILKGWNLIVDSISPFGPEEPAYKTANRIAKTPESDVLMRVQRGRGSQVINQNVSFNIGGDVSDEHVAEIRDSISSPKFMHELRSQDGTYTFTPSAR